MLTLTPDVPRVSRDKVDRALIEIDRALGGSKVLTLEEACARYGRDESETTPSAPDAVVLAETVDDVARCLAACSRNDVPVTPRGAGTGRTGGSVPVAGGIVLSTEKMKQVKEIDRNDLLVVCEPGVITGDLHAAVEREGLFYPPDPNSLATCAVGGNVAENAGGPRAFKYGVTREYVLGLTAVTMDGTVLRTGRRTVKGVAGYDVTALLVGSEGTLAVVTEATLRLVPKPSSLATLLVLFADVQQCGAAVSAMVARGVVPRCLEMVDEGALAALRGGGVAIDERARAMLIVEVDGDGDLDPTIERVGEACESAGTVDILVAQDSAQRDRLWAGRRELSPTIRRLARWKLAEDVVVPRSKIGALLLACDRIRDEEHVRMLSYGHAGDGNLHVNYLWDDPGDVPRVERAIERTFHEVLALGGTLSGEHGIGVLKAPYLGLEQSPALIDLQRRVKAAFDPKGLLNPGKIFPTKNVHAC